MNWATLLLLLIGVSAALVAPAAVLALRQKGKGACLATFAGWMLGSVSGGMLPAVWLWWMTRGLGPGRGEGVVFVFYFGVIAAAVGSVVGAWIGLGLSVLWAARAKRGAAEPEEA